MSLADTIGKLKSVSNSESKGIFSKNNKSISSRFTNLGKLLSRNGVNAGKDPANISDSKINSVATSSKNIEATAPITDKPTSIEPSTNKPSYETLSNNASTVPNITESPSIMKGSYVPIMKPIALSPASNITKAGNNTSTITKHVNSSVSNIAKAGNSSTISKSNVTNITKAGNTTNNIEGNNTNSSTISSKSNDTTNAITNKIQATGPTANNVAKSSDFTSDTKSGPKLNNTAITSSFKFDEKNNDNKLIEGELKTQTRILKDMLVELKKTNNGDMLDLLSDLKKNKKTPSVKKPSKLLQSAKNGLSKAKSILQRAGGAALDKLGSLANKSKGIIKTAANIAKNSAAKGMTSAALQTGARVLSKALPVAAAGVGWEAGTAIGGAIYDKYQNTDFMKGVGATVAKGAAFFGSGEAKQAVSDTKKYETSANGGAAPVDKNNKFDYVSAAKNFKTDKNIIGMTENETKALASITMKTESGGNQKAKNTFGFSGQYQFGAEALAGEGLVDSKKLAAAKKAAGSSWYKGGGHKAFLEDKSNWKIEGGQEAFLADKKLQDKAFVDYTNKNIKAGMKSGALKEGDSAEKIAAYAKAAHLKGSGGANDLFLRGKDSKDAYGMSAGAYAKDAGGKVAGLAKQLDGSPSTDTKVAASSKEKAIDKNVKADTTTAKTDTKVADKTKAKVADKPTSKDKSSSDRVVAINENKKQDTKSDSKISAASKDKSKTEAKIDAKMASSSTEKQIDLSVGPVTTSLAPSTKLAEVDTKYIETSQAQKEDVAVEKSQPKPQPQPQQVASSGGGNKGAVKSAMQSNAQSSKSGEDTPNIEVRKQTSTIQRVFDRDSSLMV